MKLVESPECLNAKSLSCYISAQEPLSIPSRGKRTNQLNWMILVGLNHFPKGRHMLLNRLTEWYFAKREQSWSQVSWEVVIELFLLISRLGRIRTGSKLMECKLSVHLNFKLLEFLPIWLLRHLLLIWQWQRIGSCLSSHSKWGRQARVWEMVRNFRPSQLKWVEPL